MRDAQSDSQIPSDIQSWPETSAVTTVRLENSSGKAVRLLTAARRLGATTLANAPSRQPVSLPEARDDAGRQHIRTVTPPPALAARQPSADTRTNPTEQHQTSPQTAPEEQPAPRPAPVPTPIRVLVADDQEMVRNGIRYSLDEYADITIIGEAETGEGAVALCAQLAPDLPDVVLMDMMMPGMGGVATIATLEEQWPGLPIIALTSYADGALVEEALQAGAIGYLLKDVAVEDLAKAIRLARRGTPVLAPAAAQSLVRAVSAHQPKLGQDLTEREREVLKLLAEGISNQEIAERLVITPATVKFHARSIRSKLGTTSRTETVVVALQHHLVPTK